MDRAKKQIIFYYALMHPRCAQSFGADGLTSGGARHETRPAKYMVGGIDEMLSKGMSFSLYITNGGTSFGHCAGALNHRCRW